VLVERLSFTTLMPRYTKWWSTQRRYQRAPQMHISASVSMHLNLKTACLSAASKRSPAAWHGTWIVLNLSAFRHRVFAQQRERTHGSCPWSSEPGASLQKHVCDARTLILTQSSSQHTGYNLSPCTRFFTLHTEPWWMRSHFFGQVRHQR